MTNTRRGVWAQFRTHRGAMIGAGILLIAALAVLFGPHLWSIDPHLIDIRARNQGPGLAHPLGADRLGRDTLARMLAGGRVSLAVAGAAMGLALSLGAVIGVASGYFRRLDGPLMRLTDLFLALPLLPLLLVIIALFRDALRSAFGPETGIFILIASVIGATSWMKTARIVRGEVLALKEREFVLASGALGAPTKRIIFRHVLPGVVSPIMISAALGRGRRHHHRIRALVPGSGLSAGFPHLGEAALRFDRLPPAIPRARAVARPRDFAHRAEHQLRGRRAARCARPPSAGMNAAAFALPFVRAEMRFHPCAGV